MTTRSNRTTESASVDPKWALLSEADLKSLKSDLPKARGTKPEIQGDFTRSTFRYQASLHKAGSMWKSWPGEIKCDNHPYLVAFAALSAELKNGNIDAIPSPAEIKSQGPSYAFDAGDGWTLHIAPIFNGDAQCIHCGRLLSQSEPTDWCPVCNDTGNVGNLFG